MKKFGRFLFSLVPMIAFLTVQIIVSVEIMLVIFLGTLMKDVANTGNVAPGFEIMVTADLSEYMTLIMLISGVMSAIIFGLWYYFYLKRPKLENPARVFTMKSILAIIGMCLGFYSLIDLFFRFMEFINPVMINEYNDLMEMSGAGEMSIYTILATVVLAPIYEEIIFRGLTLKLAQKFTSRFWIANLFQALAFGVVHGNLLQGSYAFVLGIVLGVLYQKYQSLYVPIFMHMVFNFTGSVLSELVFSKIDSTWGWWIFIISTLVAGVIGVIVFLKDKSMAFVQESNTVQY